jgi:DNA-directed RNA polymerase specialized sigma24 family protein
VAGDSRQTVGLHQSHGQGIDSATRARRVLIDARKVLLALDEALNKLAKENSTAAELVQLRYFADLTLPEATQALGNSPRTAGRLWAYARAWLRRAVEGDEGRAVNS